MNERSKIAQPAWFRPALRAEPGRRLIGDHLVGLGLLRTSQIEKVLRHGASTGQRFGEAAVDLGFIEPEALLQALGRMTPVPFRSIRTTDLEGIKDLFLSSKSWAQARAIPIFVKALIPGSTKFSLEVGMVDPEDDEARERIAADLKRHLGSRLLGLEFFLVDPESFARVFRSRFGMRAEDLAERTGLTPVIPAWREDEGSPIIWLNRTSEETGPTRIHVRTAMSPQREPSLSLSISG